MPQEQGLGVSGLLIAPSKEKGGFLSEATRRLFLGRRRIYGFAILRTALVVGIAIKTCLAVTAILLDLLLHLLVDVAHLLSPHALAPLLRVRIGICLIAHKVNPFVCN